MNYYKMKITDAKRLGIPLFGHRRSKTLVLVGDGDIRRVTNFEHSTAKTVEDCSLSPLTQAEFADILRSKSWEVETDKEA